MLRALPWAPAPESTNFCNTEEIKPGIHTIQTYARIHPSHTCSAHLPSYKSTCLNLHRGCLNPDGMETHTSCDHTHARMLVCCVLCVSTRLGVHHTERCVQGPFQQTTSEQRTDGRAGDDISPYLPWKGLGVSAVACSWPLDIYLVGPWPLHPCLPHLIPPAPVQKGCPIWQGTGVTLLPCENASGIPHRSLSA